MSERKYGWLGSPAPLFLPHLESSATNIPDKIPTPSNPPGTQCPQSGQSVNDKLEDKRLNNDKITSNSFLNNKIFFSIIGLVIFLLILFVIILICNSRKNQEKEVKSPRLAGIGIHGTSSSGNLYSDKKDDTEVNTNYDDIRLIFAQITRQNRRIEKLEEIIKSKNL
jgi:hypothetical protein